MALAKTDSSIIHIRGRFGGVYFKKDPSGQHIQAMPRHVNYTPSPAQKGGFGEFSPFFSFGREGFSSLAELWSLALLTFFSAAWAAYAIVTLFTTKTGERKQITGYNWFIHYGLAFPECERPPFWKPPHAVGDLPDFITTYKGRWTYEHAPLEWPEDCCSGYYWYAGEWNNKSRYRTDDFNWHIWWKDPTWCISPSPGFEPENLTFYSTGSNIIDYYRNPKTKKWAHVYIGKPQ